MRADPAPPSLGRRILAEVVGTFFLTFVDAGGAILGAVEPNAVTSIARAFAGGLVVMALVYTLGPVSGAHLNPAVTLAFAARGVFPWRHVPIYWGAALAGATLAAFVLRGMLGNIAGLGVPGAPHGAWLGLGMEILTTALLVTVVLGTATRHSIIGPNAALAVGGTVTAAALVARAATGACMNPARALGPAWVGGTTADAWIHVAGPMTGALVAVALARALHGSAASQERAAAEGDRA